MPKGKKPKKRKIDEHSFTPLERHKIKGGTVLGALSSLSTQAPMTIQSWKDKRLPNMLWASIIASQIERKKYIEIFRSISVRGEHFVNSKAPNFVTHAIISQMNIEDATYILEPVFDDEECVSALSALLLIETLPDRQFWADKLEAPAELEGWNILMNAIGSSFDHQSETATDIRWLKFNYFIHTGRMNFPNEMEELVHAIVDFPYRGDLRAVRPNIRASEMMFGEKMGDQEPVDGMFDHEAFWKFCFDKTNCVPMAQLRQEKENVNIISDEEPGNSFDEKIIEEIQNIYIELSDHFIDTIKTTDIDAKHDGVFGLALYSIYLLIGMQFGAIDTRSEGRVILRTICEIFILLHWMVKKNDDNLWNQFRNFGIGKTKLSMLKNQEPKNTPEFIDIDELFFYANEDYWQEFVDIELKAFANKNLREMASESDTKDVYDKYYDWSSGYVHANWIAVRDTVMTTCLNPLHRFHRVPWSPKVIMPSVSSDAAGLCNRILDDLNHLYPTFKNRLRAHKRSEA